VTRKRDAASAGFRFMKALPQTLVDAQVREVFSRLPLLHGFSLDNHLCLCDLEVHAWPGCEWGDPVYGEIGAAITELIVVLEASGANDLLRGRTFARSLQ
jgi:hypothetical protein